MPRENEINYTFSVIVYTRSKRPIDGTERTLTVAATSPGNARRKICQVLHQRSYFIAHMLQLNPPETFGDGC